ncbi:hypothetical protein TCAL_02025 [Tigriopus californicus]|uniref:Uncharacterized protein n=1 Tax=Tigriopus californicus TaxID=6832 RepID=A0A553PFK6_TIGCA|nr:uncharacterized protein LOC131880433 [Tigriopus californicus]TRY76454.1 hypothetical protein TCAL_02025 [Tigriopus californicus]|eukprot:TCALIF_02025-PA protein Name:"Protein of unknown function" AED:0.00 eAED:0.00 QI:246/1/1/1/0/0.5/2/143/346
MKLALISIVLSVAVISNSRAEPDAEPQMNPNEDKSVSAVPYGSNQPGVEDISNVEEYNRPASYPMNNYQPSMNNPSWAQTVPAYDMSGYPSNSPRMGNNGYMQPQTLPDNYNSMPYQPYSSPQAWNQVNPSWNQNRQIPTGVQEIPNWTPPAQQYNTPQYPMYPNQNQWNTLPAQNTWNNYQPQSAPITSTSWLPNSDNQASQTFVPGLPTWRKSYTPLPGKSGCYNRCRPSCSTSYQAGFGCQPSCRSSCNVRPSCGARGQVNWKGNTMVCGRPNYGQSWSGSNNNIQWGASPYNNMQAVPSYNGMQGITAYSNLQPSSNQNQGAQSSSNIDNGQMNMYEETEQS